MPETPLYMMKASINMRSFNNWTSQRHLTYQDHAFHCLITEVMGEYAPKPFKTLMPPDHSLITILGYTEADADQLRHAIDTYAHPEQFRIIEPETIFTKPMPASHEWEKESKLGFDLRIRPTTRFTDVVSRKHHEIDAYSAHINSNVANPAQLTPEQVYIIWLSKRLEANLAVELDSVNTKVISVVPSKSLRKGKDHFSTGADVRIKGNLTIKNPAKFHRLLKAGIGRHKAYGYGMLLLSPVLNRRAD